MKDSIGDFASIEGVWRYILPMSGLCAIDRGSKAIESVDLLKAIYIVDLEHVSEYWDNWQSYERFVMKIPLADGRKQRYINRTIQLLKLHDTGRHEPGQLVPFAPLSETLQKAIQAVRAVIRDRAGEPPSSCDFLYCICQIDHELREALSQSGLQWEKLAAAVAQSPK